MKLFICEDTFDGFFTAFYDAYKEKNCEITSENKLQLSLDTEIVRVATDPEKCGRVVNALNRYDPSAPYDAALALRSGNVEKQRIVFSYLKKIFETKTAVKGAYNLIEVVEFNELIYKITGEIHRLKGLLRFKECADGTFYAPYSPDNNITELLMPHFAERFKIEKFVLHDVKRKIAGIYNGYKWITAFAGEAEIALSNNETKFETLWKKYYNAVNIDARPHEKQMLRSMPARYWKFLPEKN